MFPMVPAENLPASPSRAERRRLRGLPPAEPPESGPGELPEPSACRRCGHGGIRSNGSVRGTRRFVCRSGCGGTFSARTGTVRRRSRRDDATWTHCARLMFGELSLPKAAERTAAAFARRHGILHSMRGMAGPKLSGTVEAGETFFRLSFKGRRKGMPRRPERRGRKPGKRGMPKEKACVPAAAGRRRGTFPPPACPGGRGLRPPAAVRRPRRPGRPGPGDRRPPELRGACAGRGAVPRRPEGRAGARRPSRPDRQQPARPAQKVDRPLQRRGGQVSGQLSPVFPAPGRRPVPGPGGTGGLGERAQPARGADAARLRAVRRCRRARERPRAVRDSLRAPFSCSRASGSARADPFRPAFRPPDARKPPQRPGAPRPAAAIVKKSLTCAFEDQVTFDFCEQRKQRGHDLGLDVLLALDTNALLDRDERGL